MRLYLSNIENTKKPNEFNIKKISSTITKNLIEISLEKFAEELTEKGKTTILCELKYNELSKHTPIVSQELVMLDFDNKGSQTFTIEDLEQDLFIQNHALFYYKTFSDTESTVDKFRVVFKLEQPATNNHTVESIYKALFKRYPMSDTSVGQTSRMFYGSNNSYELLDWDNVVSLEDLELVNQTDLVELNNSSELIDLNTPIYLLLKYKQYDLVRQKMGSYYSQVFPDDITAQNYFCEIDMKELLELPEGNPFMDIFHDEESPSASVFYSEKYNSYLYNCFSSSNKFIGDIFKVLAKLLNIKSKVETIDLLVNLTNSRIDFNSEIGIIKRNTTVFRKNLLSGGLEKDYPELYSYLNRYKLEINATLDFLYDYVYKDKETGEVRYLSYFSINKLKSLVSNAVGYTISEQKMWNILNIIVVTEMINKLPYSKVPKELYDSIITEQKENSKQIRTSNFYEPSLFDTDSISNMAEISKVLKDNNVTINSLSFELIYRLFGKEKAERDFPQAYKPLIAEGKIKMSKKDNNLTSKSISLEKTALEIIMTEIESKGYIFEDTLIKLLAKRKRLKQSVVKYQYNKIRADISNKYNLNRVRLTKELYESFDIKGKYTPKMTIYLNKN